MPGQSQNPCGDNVSLESELGNETADYSEDVPNEIWVQHVPEPDIEVQIRILKAANILHALPADQQPNREAVLKAIGILNEQCESKFAKLENCYDLRAGNWEKSNITGIHCYCEKNAVVPPLYRTAVQGTVG